MTIETAIELFDAGEDDKTDIRATFPLPVVDNVVVVATNPTEMQEAKLRLVTWGESKVLAARATLGDAESKLAKAKAMKQRTSSYKTEVALAKDEVVFYEKIKEALEQGYCIIPNFPAVDVIAVRIKADKVDPDSWDRAVYMGELQQEPDKLPAGEGRYVSADTKNIVEVREEGTEEKPKKTRYRYPESFQAVMFPARLAKMQVLEQLDSAQKKLLFDDIGTLPAVKKRHPDPIVLGRIHSRLGQAKNKTVSFMIAWWIDTKDL